MLRFYGYLKLLKLHRTERSRNKDVRSGNRTQDLLHEGRALTDCAILALRPWLKKFSYDIPPLQIDRSIVFSVNYINMVNELYSGTVRVFLLLIKGKSFSIKRSSAVVLLSFKAITLNMTVKFIINLECFVISIETRSKTVAKQRL